MVNIRNTLGWGGERTYEPPFPAAGQSLCPSTNFRHGFTIEDLYPEYLTDKGQETGPTVPVIAWHKKETSSCPNPAVPGVISGADLVTCKISASALSQPCGRSTSFVKGSLAPYHPILSKHKSSKDRAGWPRMCGIGSARCQASARRLGSYGHPISSSPASIGRTGSRMPVNSPPTTKSTQGLAKGSASSSGVSSHTQTPRPVRIFAKDVSPTTKHVGFQSQGPSNTSQAVLDFVSPVAHGKAGVLVQAESVQAPQGAQLVVPGIKALSPGQCDYTGSSEKVVVPKVRSLLTEGLRNPATEGSSPSDGSRNTTPRTSHPGTSTQETTVRQNLPTEDVVLSVAQTDHSSQPQQETGGKPCSKKVAASLAPAPLSRQSTAEQRSLLSLFLEDSLKLANVRRPGPGGLDTAATTSFPQPDGTHCCLLGPGADTCNLLPPNVDVQLDGSLPVAVYLPPALVNGLRGGTHDLYRNLTVHELSQLLSSSIEGPCPQGQRADTIYQSAEWSWSWESVRKPGAVTTLRAEGGDAFVDGMEAYWFGSAVECPQIIEAHQALPSAGL